jgi:branched-chain amino acid transport system substrate-binding protein
MDRILRGRARPARRGHIVGVALVAVVALMAAGCGGGDDGEKTSGTTRASAGDRGNVNGTLELGALVPQTGALAAIVESLTTGVDIALEEINEAGGVLGKQVKLTVRDDGTDKNVAAASLTTLLDSDKVDAIIGPAASGTALGILKKVRDAGVVMCSGSNTAAELSTEDSGGYYFRTAPPDKFQGPALAELVLADGRTKPAIIVRNDSYGVGFGDALKQALTDGGATVGDVVAYDPNGTNFDADVQKVIDQGPDAVIVIGFVEDGAKILKTMIDKGVGPDRIPIYTADGMQSGDLGKTVDPDNPGVVAGIKGTAPAAAPAGIDHPFNAKMQATGVDPIFSAYYYDCTILIALAAEKAGSDDPAKIRAAFAENLAGDTDCTTFAECKQALADGKRIHYRGASSRFDNWAGHEPGEGVYERWSYDAEGKVVTEDASTQIRIGG